MNKKFAIRLTLFAILTILVLGGCRSAPIYSTTDHPITITSGKEVQLEDIKKTIIGTGLTLGWSFVEKEPGHLLGTFINRNHIAKVDVKFTTSKFSITYSDSEHMGFTGTTIHRNFNKWVQTLHARLNARLGML